MTTAQLKTHKPKPVSVQKALKRINDRLRWRGQCIETVTIKKPKLGRWAVFDMFAQAVILRMFDPSQLEAFARELGAMAPDESLTP